MYAAIWSIFSNWQIFYAIHLSFFALSENTRRWMRVDYVYFKWIICDEILIEWFSFQFFLFSTFNAAVINKICVKIVRCVNKFKFNILLDFWRKAYHNWRMGVKNYLISWFVLGKFDTRTHQHQSSLFGRHSLTCPQKSIILHEI